MQREIRKIASELGFDAIGFTKVFSPEHRDYFLNWLDEKKFAGMTWLAKNTDKRLKPQTLMENTKSALVLALSYNHHESERHDIKVARYAHGADYHSWVKKKLEDLAMHIQTHISRDFKWRSFVDTGPILERDLAVKAGLGWIGKNTCLIHETLGSFVFLGVIFSNLEFPQAALVTDQCGKCNLCIEACPTQALTPYQLDAQKCLAYHNIEKRGEREMTYWQSLGSHLVGCDICQEVCPWNFQAEETGFKDWLNGFSNYDVTDLKVALAMSERGYKQKFSDSAISRIKYVDFMRNIFLVIANLQQKEFLDDVIQWQKQNPNLHLAEYEYCMGVLSRDQTAKEMPQPHSPLD